MSKILSTLKLSTNPDLGHHLIQNIHCRKYNHFETKLIDASHPAQYECPSMSKGGNSLYDVTES